MESNSINFDSKKQARADLRTDAKVNRTIGIDKSALLVIKLFRVWQDIA